MMMIMMMIMMMMGPHDSAPVHARGRRQAGGAAQHRCPPVRRQPSHPNSETGTPAGARSRGLGPSRTYEALRPPGSPACPVSQSGRASPRPNWGQELPFGGWRRPPLAPSAWAVRCQLRRRRRRRGAADPRPSEGLAPSRRPLRASGPRPSGLVPLGPPFRPQLRPLINYSRNYDN